MIYFVPNDPENGKHLQMNSEKVGTLHGIIILPNMCAKVECYDKNWMHFVYKLDHLFRSVRVLDENSTLTKAFHFSKLLRIQELLCIQYASFKGTY